MIFNKTIIAFKSRLLKLPKTKGCYKCKINIQSYDVFPTCWTFSVKYGRLMLQMTLRAPINRDCPSLFNSLKQSVWVWLPKNLQAASEIEKKIITLGYDITVWEVLQTYFLLSTIQKNVKKINKSKCKSAKLLKNQYTDMENIR